MLFTYEMLFQEGIFVSVAIRPQLITNMACVVVGTHLPTYLNGVSFPDKGLGMEPCLHLQLVVEASLVSWVNGCQQPFVDLALKALIVFLPSSVPSNDIIMQGRWEGSALRPLELDLAELAKIIM